VNKISEVQYDEFVVFQEAQALPSFAITFREKKDNPVVFAAPTIAKIPVENWSVEQVADWLKGLKLSQSFESQIQSNHITGAVLKDMTRADWKEIGITALGDLKIIETELKKAM
jgi:hypothetical protein